MGGWHRQHDRHRRGHRHPHRLRQLRPPDGQGRAARGGRRRDRAGRLDRLRVQQPALLRGRAQRYGDRPGAVPALPRRRPRPGEAGHRQLSWAHWRSLRSRGPVAPQPTSSFVASLLSPDAGRHGPAPGYSLSIGAWRSTIHMVWSPKSICAWARAPVPSTAKTRPTPQRWWVTRSPATRLGTLGSSLAVVRPAADTPSRSASFDAFALPAVLPVNAARPPTPLPDHDGYAEIGRAHV